MLMHTKLSCGRYLQINLQPSRSYVNAFKLTYVANLQTGCKYGFAGPSSIIRWRNNLCLSPRKEPSCLRKCTYHSPTGNSSSLLKQLLSVLSTTAIHLDWMESRECSKSATMTYNMFLLPNHDIKHICNSSIIFGYHSTGYPLHILAFI